ncbi:MAG: transporter substrate-binding domain-containing protein [Cyanobacteria bacterium J06600_6]
MSYLPQSNSAETAFDDPIGLEPELLDSISQDIVSAVLPEEQNAPKAINKYWFPYNDIEWQGILEETRQSNCDLAISSLSITKERENEYKVKFSDPYLYTNLALIANKQSRNNYSIDEDNIDLLKILKGQKVGVLDGSTSQQTLEEFNKLLLAKNTDQTIQIKHFETVSDALINLDTRHDVNFVLADKVYTDFHLFQNSEGLQMLCELKEDLYPQGFPAELIGEKYGIAVNYRDSRLLQKINRTIDNLRETRELRQMRDKHESKYKENNSTIFGQPMT